MKRQRSTGVTTVHRNQRKFTLVEMLVVIAIIGVLAAMLMPSLQSALSASRTMICSSNLRQIHMVLQGYADDNNNCIPPYNCFGDFSSTDYGAYGVFSSFVQGIAYGLPTTKWGKDGGGVQSEMFLCPSDPNPKRKVGPCDMRVNSYNANYYVWRSIGSRSTLYADGNTKVLNLIRDIRHPSIIGLMGDVPALSDTDGRAGGFVLTNSSTLYTHGGSFCWGNDSYRASGVRLPHPDGKAFLMNYFDGHVEPSFFPDVPSTMLSNWLKTQ